MFRSGDDGTDVDSDCPIELKKINSNNNNNNSMKKMKKIER
jgi:hypothetical protein